ncbi:MAG TPA: hypothetical protein VJQ82_13520 [Terriglobales bacterium]|nr:hypothetical protein [Terriglobales bacterium]
MRTLLIHSGDHPDGGPWAAETWSRVIDLGLGGAETYGRWREKLGCEVVSLESYRRGFQEILRVRELLAEGRGRLVDRDGLDWWEVTAILIHPQLEVLVLLARWLETVGDSEEVYISRPGLHADILRAFLGERLHVFPRRDSRAARYLRLGAKFSLGEMTQIFWDKYDPGHRIRGGLARKVQRSQKPVVLVPSAYVNVTRTGIAYARTVPDVNFLVVATRKSGWLKDAPENVRTVWFAAYSSFASQRHLEDQRVIVEKWNELRRRLEDVTEFRVLGQLGLLEQFPEWFRQGLRQRDIWSAVFENQPVQAVFCADDTNPSTHIPVWLAKKFGVPAIACHHGALDGRYMLKRNHSDMILAKSEMERDYLVRVCGVSSREVEIGAPKSATAPVEKEARSASRILLFSEFYEVFSGRPEEFYRELLPALADLARAHGKKLTVKLHPFESERERRGMIAAVLSAAQREVVEVLSVGSVNDLSKEAWFAVTVLSTVAMECSRLGVPCFLCKWLEFWPYGYVDQFTRFGVGYALMRPGEIAEIPKILEQSFGQRSTGEELVYPIDPRRLKQLLTSGPLPDAVATTASLDRVG